VVPYPLRIILTAYANQYRLKKYLGHDDPASELRQILQQRWKELSDSWLDSEGVNILMTHLFFMRKGGPRPEEPEDEKPILTVGGAQEIYTENLPDNIQYVALGHLHRQHQVSDKPCPVVYSGSPLAYSMSEAGQEKSVILIDAEPGKPVEWKTIPLTAGKKLLRKTFDNLDEAVKWLNDNPETLVELTMISDRYLTAASRKRLYDAHEGIVTLIPKVTDPELQELALADIDLNKDIEELFKDYFKQKHVQAPGESILDLFREILAEETED
jgi:exonuclease SbcD